MPTENHVALVTGANRGIGKEVSRQLTKAGFTVLLGGRSLANAEATVAELGSTNLLPIELDVADRRSIIAAHSHVERNVGRLDVLINNAAIHYDSWQRAATADMSVVREAMETNVYGPWRLCKVFLPLLAASPHPTDRQCK